PAIGLRHLSVFDRIHVEQYFPERYALMTDFVPVPGVSVPFLVEMNIVSGTQSSPVYAWGIAELSMSKGSGMGNRMDSNWYSSANRWRIGVQGGVRFRGYDVYTGEPVSF